MYRMDWDGMGYAAGTGVATALKVVQRHRIYLWKYFETAVMFICLYQSRISNRKRNLEERGGNWTGVGMLQKWKVFLCSFLQGFAEKLIFCSESGSGGILRWQEKDVLNKFLFLGNKYNSLLKNLFWDTTNIFFLDAQAENCERQYKTYRGLVMNNLKPACWTF